MTYEQIAEATGLIQPKRIGKKSKWKGTWHLVHPSIEKTVCGRWKLPDDFPDPDDSPTTLPTPERVCKVCLTTGGYDNPTAEDVLAPLVRDTASKAGIP